MLLTEFNLAKHIKEYNRINDTNHLERTHFGFELFSLAHIQNINDSIKSINEGYDLYLLSDDDLSRCELKQNQLKNHIELINQATIGKLALIKDTINYLKSNDVINLNERLNCIKRWHLWLAAQAKIEYDEKIAKQHIFTSNTEICDEEIKAKLIIARFNDTAVYKLAKETLPYLFEYIKRARKKLLIGKHSIPQDIGDKYFKYLTDFEKSLKYLQSYFCNSMLERLKAFDESKGRYSNPLYLKASKTNPALSYPAQPYRMSSNEFVFFHEYIEKHGNFEAKKQLSKCSWFVDCSSLTTTIVKTQDNGNIITPVRLAHYIPLKKRWPNWLFGDINLRQDLFKQNALLFASLKFHVNKPEYFIAIYDPKLCLAPIEEIKLQEKLIEESILKLESPPFNNISWYSFGTKNLCHEWKSTLQDQKVKLIENKFALAERLISCLKSQIVNPIQVPWETYKVLLNLSTELEQLIKQNNVHRALQDKMYSINTTLSQYASLTKFLESVNKLAKGELPAGDQLDFLHRYFDGRSSVEPNFLESFKQYCEPEINAIKNQLYLELKTDPFSHRSKDDLEKQSKLVVSYYSLLSKTKVNLDDKYITQRIKKLFLRCLQDMLSQNHNQCPIAFKECKALIKQLGKNVKYLDKDLSEHIESLEKQKSESPILFYINCKSIFISLGNALIKQRFNKEMTQLDHEIISVLDKKGLSAEVITSLLKIRDKLIKGDFLETLTPSDKKVLEIYSAQNTSNLLDLLNLSAKAHHVKASLDSDISSAKKPQIIKTLSQSISQFLSRSKYLSPSLQNKKWFAKQYIDETIIKNNSTNLSFNF
jgi:hypothetical protein